MIASIFFMHFPSRQKNPHLWEAHARLGAGKLSGCDNALTRAPRQSQIIDFDNKKFALAFPELHRYISPPSTVQSVSQALRFASSRNGGKKSGH
jgi:hypothetical protein